jgi:CHAT domain-containing protein
MAAEELDEVATTYGSARHIEKPVVGAAATSAALRAAISHPRAQGGTLHIVSHGDFVPEEPLYSGLLMTDGKLDAATISRTALPYDEVVLSACSTGYRPAEVGGVPLSGDDVIGLVGAFLEAGARNVVVSITVAQDHASYAFMTRYHGFRAGGVAPVAALQQTQKAMLEEATCSPRLWAGFVVYGT